MKDKTTNWSSGNTVTLSVPVVCIDCRTRWKRFKDFFKPRREVVFNSKERIIHHADSLKIPAGNK